MKILTAAAFKKYLATLPQEALLQEMADLFAKIPAVKAYYQTRLASDNQNEVLEKYKAKVYACFFSRSGMPKLDRAGARDAVNEFKRIAARPQDEVAIMLYYVETATELTSQFGDIDENFYVATENMFDKACDLIQKHNLLVDFDKQCLGILKAARDIGWGFPDALRGIYQQHFGPL
ncbi:MAG: DUF6155 family protein [Anaerolineae bacterium]|nr:DUF6155 family protein [Anaerolineae bacterium]